MKKTLQDLLDDIITDGGCLVLDAVASEMEIAHAEVEGRFAVDEMEFGYIRRTAEWLAGAERAGANA